MSRVVSDTRLPAPLSDPGTVDTAPSGSVAAFPVAAARRCGGAGSFGAAVVAAGTGIPAGVPRKSIGAIWSATARGARRSTDRSGGGKNVRDFASTRSRITIAGTRISFICTSPGASGWINTSSASRTFGVAGPGAIKGSAGARAAARAGASAPGALGEGTLREGPLWEARTAEGFRRGRRASAAGSGVTR